MKSGLILFALSLCAFLWELGGFEYDVSLKVILYIIGWLFLVMHVVALCKLNIALILTSTYQIIYYLFISVAATMASFGSHMYEIKQTGTPNGAFWLAIIFFIITMSGLKRGYYSFESKLRTYHFNTTGQDKKYFVNMAVLTLFIIAFLILLTYGSPILQGINRVIFWTVIVPSGFSLFRVVFILGFFFIGIKFTHHKFNFLSKTYSLLVFTTTLFLIAFLFGEKMSMFIMLITAILFVYAAKKTNKHSKWLTVGLPIFVLFLVVNVAFIYVKSGLSYNFIFSRIVLQCQLLWSTLNEASETLWFGSIIFEESFSVSDFRQYLSERVLPAAVLKAHAISKTTLSGYSPAWQIHSVGIIGASVLVWGGSFILGVIQLQVVSQLKKSQHLRGFALYSIHFFLLSVIYVGNFNVLPGVLACILFLIALTLAPKKERL